MCNHHKFWFIGLCALALGLGILITAIFPIGRAAVSHCFFADRVRHRLPAPVGMKGDVP